MESNENTPLLRASVQTLDGATRVYFRRWYILAVFSLLTALQAMMWNTWGPIADTARAVYGWTQFDVALLSNWGPITFVLTAFFFSWLMENKGQRLPEMSQHDNFIRSGWMKLILGLRISVLVASGCLFLGTVLRCIPCSPEDKIWVLHPGQLFIGLAGPVAMTGPTVISAVWFPPHQRTTSTAVGAIAAIVGVALSFIIGPQLVHDVNSVNASTISSLPEDGDFLYGHSTEDKHRQMLEINNLMYLECGITALCFFASVMYFPKKPPLPPSRSASMERVDFFTGVKSLCTKWTFLAPGLAYGIYGGVYGGWTTQLTSILDNIGVDQDSAGWMGFYGNMAGVVGGLVFSRIVDLLGGKIMKLILLALTFLSMLTCVWIVLMCGKYIKFSTVDIWIAYIASGFFIGSLIPLFYEICAEGAYPIGESSTTGFITWLNNVACLVFLLVASVHALGYAWMNWAMLGAVVLVIPLLLMYKEHYNRLEIDVTDN